MKNIFTTLLLCVFYLSLTQAQNVGIGTSSPDASAKLDISSSDMGLLIPRVSLSDLYTFDLVGGTGTAGMIVFNTNAGLAPNYGVGFYYWANGEWQKVATGNALQASLNDGKIWIGNATNTPTQQTPNGDVVVSNTGTFTIQDNAVDGTDIQLSSNAAGDLMYYNGTDWVRLAAGTTGQLLQSNGTGAPSWVNTNAKSWDILGNTGTTAPAAPSTYGTSTFGANENHLGTNDAQDLAIGTNNIERLRILSDGRMGVGTASPSSNYLMTINASNNTLRSGISMNLSGMSSSATGINITTGVSAVNGIQVTHSSSALSSSLYAIGGVLSSTNIVSGYAGYRTGAGNSYGLYGINGTNGTYATNASTWALFSQGRAVISSASAPSSALGIDLEVQNTTTGAAAPATIQLRQTTQLGTSGNILANLNFGDAYATSPQAQIQVLRDAAAGSSSDMPTAMTFSTIADGGSTLTERLRIGNAGAITVNSLAGTGTRYVTASATGVLSADQNPSIPKSVSNTTIAGSYTVNIPANTTGIIIKAVGAGGGGGGQGSGDGDGGGGGGSGAYAELYLKPSDWGSNTAITGTVGAGGTGGGGGENNGSAGGSTTIVIGGTTFATIGGGGGGINGNGYAWGGSGGTASISSGIGYVINGTPGQQGHDAGTYVSNMGGGSGGNSVLGQGGRGANDVNLAEIGGFGGGGGAGWTDNDCSDRAGVAGGTGRVIIIFY